MWPDTHNRIYTMKNSSSSGLQTCDAVIIGTGLAGLTASIHLAEKGCKVTLIEKASTFGGNSIKASSGINGVPTEFQLDDRDSVDAFIDDIMRSGQGLSNPTLVEILANGSKEAIDWLANENSIDLQLVSQLGGHSFSRTHRGSGNLPPGYAIVSSLVRRLESLEKSSDRLTILKSSSLSKLLLDNGRVYGVEYTSGGAVHTLFSNNVVLATGGFSADFESEDSLIAKYRPDLLNLSSTNGRQTTGDGLKIAVRDAKAKTIHMSKVQIHPTGFVDIAHPESMKGKWRVLCGEIMRGIGGILISPVSGDRFTNEMGTREVVSNDIMSHCRLDAISKLNIESGIAVALIVISSKDYEKAKLHIDFYMRQGLLIEGKVADLAKLIKELNSDSRVDVDRLKHNLDNYNHRLLNNCDTFGRKVFGSEIEPDEPFYFGLITPVIHYTMGGLEINENCQVMNFSDQPVENLYAIGEVSGGLHGQNRLGGSSLLECVVFGKLVSEKIMN